MIISINSSIIVCSCETKEIKSKTKYKGKEIFLCKKCLKELEVVKLTIKEKYNICLKLKQFDRAKVYLNKLKEMEE